MAKLFDYEEVVKKDDNERRRPEKKERVRQDRDFNYRNERHMSEEDLEAQEEYQAEFDEFLDSIKYEETSKIEREEELENIDFSSILVNVPKHNNQNNKKSNVGNIDDLITPKESRDKKKSFTNKYAQEIGKVLDEYTELCKLIQGFVRSFRHIAQEKNLQPTKQDRDNLDRLDYLFHASFVEPLKFILGKEMLDPNFSKSNLSNMKGLLSKYQYPDSDEGEEEAEEITAELILDMLDENPDVKEVVFKQLKEDTGEQHNPTIEKVEEAVIVKSESLSEDSGFTDSEEEYQRLLSKARETVVETLDKEEDKYSEYEEKYGEGGITKINSPSKRIDE